MTFQGASSSSSSSFTRPCPPYDVYLSIRGKDTPRNVTDHLYHALRQKGICIYREDETLRRGVNISQEVLKAINASRIAVVVISKNYASSEWPLIELMEILECREIKEQIVVPLFYKVDPSDVRHQKKKFGEAFDRHEERFKDDFPIWKTALNEVANLIGWHYKQENESVFLDKVVEDILNKRIPTNLKISIYPLRYDTCHEYLSLFLQVGSKDVLIVGIFGQSRMGKTAIAKAIYNQISFTFEGSSFLTGVGQNSKQPNGLVHLQEKLMSDILLERNIAITNVTRGMDMIKEKLCFKRVLIVLDDVDDLDQLYYLVGNRNWFGLGSKIIITTRNVHLLNVFGVDQILSAQGLPLPQNIEDIWEPFQQSSRTIAGLKEYIQTFSNLRNGRMRNLQDCLLKERQKNAIQEQVILDLKQAQGLDYGQQVTMMQINY